MSHAHFVMNTLESQRSSLIAGLNDGVRDSWMRSASEHCLEPERVSDPDVLSHPELLQRRAPVEELMALSRPEIDRLAQRLQEHGQVVMLSDADGVVVLYRCSENVLEQCTALRVLPGSIWTEQSQGTNGIGLCLQERRAVSVVQGEHFATKLSRLSCTVAPIFGAEGRLVATLNVSSLQMADPVVQGMVRELVVNSARRLENLAFDRRHARRRVLRLSRYDDFCDSASEARIAIDDHGRVLDATPLAQQLLARPAGAAEGLAAVVGQRITQLAGVRCIDRFVEQPTTPVAGPHGPVYVRVAEPVRVAPHAGTVQQRGQLAPTPSRTDERQLPSALEALIGDDPSLYERLRIAQRLHARRMPLLLQGESGSGKTQLARALHEAGPHTRGGFVAINCAAIPQELMESELFGHRPGAFTGAAKQGAPGRLLGADGGTLFLDEIGDMPLPLQARLLQVLSEGEFVPVGATQPVRVQFALVSATLRDLRAMVLEGLFREDLYYRLSGATLVLPPLRQRGDRASLIDRVFMQVASEAGMGHCELSQPAREHLDRYEWPGNIRELQHVARFAVAIADGATIDVQDLPPPLGNSAGLGGGDPASPARRQGRDDDPGALVQCLERHGWNVLATAAALGISRATLHRRINQFQLCRPARSRDGSTSP